MSAIMPGSTKCTPVITFNQPLWLKAHMIVESQPDSSDLHSVVVLLGGFHAEMRFLGSIGHLMKGSWMENLLQVIYASNTVDHILSGKAVTLAVSGHCIVDASLHSLLTAKVIDVTLPAENTDPDLSMESEDVATTSTKLCCKRCRVSEHRSFSSHDVQDLSDLMNQLLSGETSTDDIEQNCTVSKILTNVSCEERNLSSIKQQSCGFST